MGAQNRTADPRRTLGALGEDLAAAHLERAGYRIAERNFRTRYGEIDLVAYDERCLVFCEVKTRRLGGSSGPATPFEAIGRAKRRQLRAMSREWFRKRSTLLPWHPEQTRFDAIGIVIDARGKLVALDHLEAAF
jgi:putative endonuclease